MMLSSTWRIFFAVLRHSAMLFTLCFILNKPEALGPLWWYSGLNNLLVLGSSLKMIVLPYVGLSDYLVMVNNNCINIVLINEMK